MNNFEPNPKCIKCGFHEPIWKYCEQLEPGVDYCTGRTYKGSPECIDLTCDNCGYSWNMKTKDQK